MEKSAEINELSKALIRFRLKVKTVAFDANNPYYKSKYATLTALVNESKDELSNCGLAVSQIIEDSGAVTTILMHESGQFISGRVHLKPVKEDPQGCGSAITYSRRYAYASILGLVSDQDDDGNAASHKPEEKKVESVKDIPRQVPLPLINDKEKSILLDLIAVKGMTEKQLVARVKKLGYDDWETMNTWDYKMVIDELKLKADA